MKKELSSVACSSSTVLQHLIAELTKALDEGTKNLIIDLCVDLVDQKAASFCIWSEDDGEP